jgi:hypothetical protein
MTEPGRVVVAVDRDRFRDVVAALRRVGLRVEQEWPETGTLAGRLEPHLLADVQAVDGVVAVEPERTFRLPPPDAEIQ